MGSRSRTLSAEVPAAGTAASWPSCRGGTWPPTGWGGWGRSCTRGRSLLRRRAAAVATIARLGHSRRRAAPPSRCCGRRPSQWRPPPETPALVTWPPALLSAVRVAVGGAVGGLAAAHRLDRVGAGPFGGAAAPGWAAHQLWECLSDRLVGVLAVGVYGAAGTAAYGMGVRLGVGAGVLPAGAAVAEGGTVDAALWRWQRGVRWTRRCGGCLRGRRACGGTALRP